MLGLSFSRWWAIVGKEFIQLRRDRLTLSMIISIPFIQLTLFGFAINATPKHLPAAVTVSVQDEITRSFVVGLRNTNYFDIKKIFDSEEEGNEAIRRGEVQFVLNIPVDFTRKMVRGEQPSLLMEADATDPIATSGALGAVSRFVNTALSRELSGSLHYLAPGTNPFIMNLHQMYNPESNTQYNIVPGLMGVILNMTMVMMTGMAITRERERGTMENLMASPARPIEIMSGKLIPFVLIGLTQATMILCAAHFVFNVPIFGNLFLLYGSLLVFIGANLTVGITLSSLARNQMQSMQMTFFYFLPSLLLSGFMFPFYGMPKWAQWLGNLLPLTHFLRIARGVILKGNTFLEVWPNIWPMLLFATVIMTIGVNLYRKTLD